MRIGLWSLVALTFVAPGGEIFGDVRVGENYLADAPVQLTCGDESVKGSTDKSGSFRLAAKATGKCVFSVTYNKANLAVDVVLFAKPARYRLVVETKDGTAILKRV